MEGDFKYNTIEEAVEDLKAGKIILCSDDPDRENEGDLICAGQFATTDNINFMAVHGRGLCDRAQEHACLHHCGRGVKYHHLAHGRDDDQSAALQ